MSFSSSLFQGNFIGFVECSNLFANEIFITLQQCHAACGTGWKPYDHWDAVEAILNWVVPLFALIGNANFPSFQVPSTRQDRRRQPTSKLRLSRVTQISGILMSYSFNFARTVSNPVVTIASLLDKLGHPHKVRREIDKQSDLLGPDRTDIENLKRDLTTLIVAMDEFELLPTYANALPPEEPPDKISLYYIVDRLLQKVLLSKILRSDLEKISRQIRVVRVSSIRRTGIAIFVYVCILFATLASTQASNDPPVHTPHTIALRILHFWLFLVVILSSATRPFATERTAYELLRPLTLKVGFTLVPLGLANGGNAIHRPQRTKSIETWAWAMAYMSMSAACVCSFLTSYLSPTTGLGCRSLTELGFWTVYNLTLALSVSLTSRKSINKPDYANLAFYIIYAVELCISITMIMVLLIAFQGWWNSCDCWAGSWLLNTVNSMVPMNIPTKVRELKYLYYGVTAIALAVQVLLASISLIILRHSLRIIHDKGDPVHDKEDLVYDTGDPVHDKGDPADQENSQDFELAIWPAHSRVHQHKRLEGVFLDKRKFDCINILEEPC